MQHSELPFVPFSPPFPDAIPYALYARTSTEELQSPADSLLWQYTRAEALIRPHGGYIAVIYHDVGFSRSLPWVRRDEARQLLDDLRDPGRGWSNVVIAEPARAFAGNEGSMIIPRLTHYGVTLWIPELGGAVDPTSEAHETMLQMYGSMSKAERSRIRMRVSTTMRAQATQNRWFGGRPPYGYRLRNIGLHPKPEKAREGIQLRALEVDPDTAAVVERIFAMYLEGKGFRAIANVLTAEGIPSPSAQDPDRNKHRPGHAWASSAVRAILINKTYTGVREYGQTHKTDRLIDPEDVALGYTTRREVVGDTVSGEAPVIISAEIAAKVAASMKARGRDSHPTPGSVPALRSEPGRYPFAGMIRCGSCGRMLQGVASTRHGQTYINYRCKLSSPDYAITGNVHPAIAVSHRRINMALMRWVAEGFTPEWVDRQVEMVCSVQPARQSDLGAKHLRRELVQAQTAHSNVLKAIENGFDIVLGVARSKELTAKIEDLERRIELAVPERPAGIDPAVARRYLTDMASLLARATDDELADFWRAAQLQMEYKKCDGSETLNVSLPLSVPVIVSKGGHEPQVHTFVSAEIVMKAAA